MGHIEIKGIITDCITDEDRVKIVLKEEKPAESPYTDYFPWLYFEVVSFDYNRKTSKFDRGMEIIVNGNIFENSKGRLVLIADNITF